MRLAVTWARRCEEEDDGVTRLRVERAKVPENSCHMRLSGQDDLFINGCTKPLRGSFLAVMRGSVLSCDTLSCLSMGCCNAREPTHIFGHTHSFRIVAPSQRPLGALGSVPPDRQRSSYETATCPDDPRYAIAAAGPKNPKGVCDRCCRLSQVLRVLSRALESRADSYLPAPSPRR